ncbi:MAG TPA: hypothetical protein VK447_02090 [Myxococcaceae bacterium]|nr:hypothetical protein [Myxococcaceae bacterium]
MTWSAAYLGCFLLGLTFVVLSMAVGHFGADAGHGDSGGHDAGGHDGFDVPLPLLSPSVLAIFVGMFGAGGLVLMHGLGITSPAVHSAGAAGISLTSGFGMAYAMMKLMRHAETNSRARHSDVVGLEVEVTQSIRGGEPGEIAYVAGGTRHTLVAQGDGVTTFAQGDVVRVLEVVDGGVARVGPPLPRLMEPGGEEAVGVSVGTPVSRDRQR